MIRVVDIVYYSHNEYTDPLTVMAKHAPTLGFIPYLKEKVDYTVIRHLNHEGKKIIGGIHCAFFKRSNAAWQIPHQTHRYIKSLQPDIVLVHGFVFPLQVVALKLLLGKHCSIVLQHHAEQPRNSIRKIFQKLADRFVATYMFTAADIAASWLSQGIIRNKEKIVELAGASVDIEKRGKTICKQQLGLSGTDNFLWVGRLNENKDPLTVIMAFLQYVAVRPAAMLYMIYQTEELLEEVKKIIAQHESSGVHIQLLGKMDRADLTEWYNAADFFISGSHAEAAGYALLEAMSVGCIPVVTNIPSYRKILNNGAAGFLFQPGDRQDLILVLNQLCTIDNKEQGRRTEDYFNKYLHFKNVAAGLYDLFVRLHAVQQQQLLYGGLHRVG